MFSLKSAALAALALVFLASPAFAKPTSTQREGRSAWTANGVRYTHETQRMHGKVVHWERTATMKDGSTKIVGKTWGSSYKGSEQRDGNTRYRHVTVQGSDGTTRDVTSAHGDLGSSHTVIRGIPGIGTRTVRTTIVNGAPVTKTEDTDVAGNKLSP